MLIYSIVWLDLYLIYINTMSAWQIFKTKKYSNFFSREVIFNDS